MPQVVEMPHKVFKIELLDWKKEVQIPNPFRDVKFS